MSVLESHDHVTISQAAQNEKLTTAKGREASAKNIDRVLPAKS